MLLHRLFICLQWGTDLPCSPAQSCRYGLPQQQRPGSARKHPNKHTGHFSAKLITGSICYFPGCRMEVFQLLKNPGVTGMSGYAQSLTGISRRSKPPFGEGAGCFLHWEMETNMVVGNGCGHNKPSICSTAQ